MIIAYCTRKLALHRNYLEIYLKYANSLVRAFSFRTKIHKLIQKHNEIFKNKAEIRNWLAVCAAFFSLHGEANSRWHLQTLKIFSVWFFFCSVNYYWILEMDQTWINSLHLTITPATAHSFVHLICSFCHNSPRFRF